MSLGGGEIACFKSCELSQISVVWCSIVKGSGRTEHFIIISRQGALYSRFRPRPAHAHAARSDLSAVAFVAHDSRSFASSRYVHVSRGNLGNYFVTVDPVFDPFPYLRNKEDNLISFIKKQIWMKSLKIPINNVNTLLICLDPLPYIKS